jgi:hypothetical protein
MRAKFELQFSDGYIANPYWQEIEWLLSVQQDAGVHFKHKPPKARELVETYLKDQGIPIAKFDAAQKKVDTEFWYKDPGGNIYIPRHQFQGSIVQSLHPNQGRIRHRLGTAMSREQVRTFIRVSDLTIAPAKKKADSMFSRYVKHPKTNMRRLQQDEIINDFVASGTVDFRDHIIKDQDMESLLRWAGQNVGVGSARLMGIGRWELLAFAADKATASKLPDTDTVVDSEEEATERRKSYKDNKPQKEEE